MKIHRMLLVFPLGVILCSGVQAYRVVLVYHDHTRTRFCVCMSAIGLLKTCKGFSSLLHASAATPFRNYGLTLRLLHASSPQGAQKISVSIRQKEVSILNMTELHTFDNMEKPSDNDDSDELAERDEAKFVLEVART
jgi:hypothetical protein